MFLVPPPSPAGNAARGPLRPLRPHRTRVFRAGLRLFRVAGALQTGAEGVALSERSKREFAFYRRATTGFEISSLQIVLPVRSQSCTL